MLTDDSDHFMVIKNKKEISINETYISIFIKALIQNSN